MLDTNAYFCDTVCPKYELVLFKLFQKNDRSLWLSLGNH